MKFETCATIVFKFFSFNIVYYVTFYKCTTEVRNNVYSWFLGYSSKFMGSGSMCSPEVPSSKGDFKVPLTGVMLANSRFAFYITINPPGPKLPIAPQSA